MKNSNMAFDFTQGGTAEILPLIERVPELGQVMNAFMLQSRLKGRKALILYAKHHDNPVAFKIGYALSDSIFYSWLGGVLPQYRRLGVAKQLRERQEAWVKKQGYSRLRVKSMNRFPAMLQLLIAGGYHICGYEDLGDPACSKIIFEKNLTASQ